jgi:uncharacterized RDD family membrane protein YckC
MTCNYCGFRLGEDDRRCRHCGRRPADAAGDAPTVIGALATQRRLAPRLAPVILDEPAAGPADFTRASQARFAFPDRSAPRVIPFGDYAPARSETRRPTGPTPKGQPRRAPRPPGAAEGQGSLDFLPPAPAKPRTLGTTVDAVIFCEAPVARRMHRAIAAALDWVIVLLAYGLFLTVFYLAGGQFDLNRNTLMAYGGALALIAVTYGLVWVLAGSETFGMRWARLRLVTFDGFPPDMKQRITRFAGSCLSVCTVLGLAWSLGDEETLTWPDHISRTFPTPKESDKDVLRRR